MGNTDGHPAARIRFAPADCDHRPDRSQCVASTRVRMLPIRPQTHYDALNAGRRRQHTVEFKEQFSRRAGI